MESEGESKVYYFKCSECGSGIFWTDIKPSVERAARVFKWVRAGCPHGECGSYLILSAPDKIYDREEAKKVFEEMKARGDARVYLI